MEVVRIGNRQKLERTRGPRHSWGGAFLRPAEPYPARWGAGRRMEAVRNSTNYVFSNFKRIPQISSHRKGSSRFFFFFSRRISIFSAATPKTTSSPTMIAGRVQA